MKDDLANTEPTLRAGSGVRAARLRKDRAAAPGAARGLILTVAAFVAAAIWWASVTEIGEIARAEGEIAPTGELSRVDHFDGGFVRSVHVAPGDEVEKGQLLAVLSQPGLTAERDELARQLADVEHDAARLLRLLANGAPEPGAAFSVSAGVGAGVEPRSLADYAAAQAELFVARERILEDRVRQRKAAIAAAARLRDNAADRMGLNMKVLARLEALEGKGVVSPAQLLAQTDVAESVRAELLDAEVRRIRAESDHQDAVAALDEARLALREEHLAALRDLERERQRLSLTLAETEARIGRLTIRAPESGVIQSAAIGGPGEVAPPGGTVFELLPTGQRLVAIVRIAPADIGHIAPGHAVKLKPTTFDARRYGDVTGRIESVSPTSVVSEREEPYFRTTVALDSVHIGEGAWRRRLRAGMVVAAEIETDRRTVLEYLLKPINRSLDRSLTER